LIEGYEEEERELMGMGSLERDMKVE